MNSADGLSASAGMNDSSYDVVETASADHGDYDRDRC